MSIKADYFLVGGSCEINRKMESKNGCFPKQNIHVVISRLLPGSCKIQ